VVPHDGMYVIIEHVVHACITEWVHIGVTGSRRDGMFVVWGGNVGALLLQLEPQRFMISPRGRKGLSRPRPRLYSASPRVFFSA
jgi:hypothetical protein